MNEKERRVSKRWQCNLPAEIKFQNGRIAEATIRSIGKNGALIEAKSLATLAVADRFTLTIAPNVWRVNGEGVAVDATVSRQTEDTATWGVTFHAVPPAVGNLLHLLQP